MLPRSRILRVIALICLALSLTTPATLAANGASFSLRPARYDPSRPATQSYFIYRAALGQVIQDEVQVGNSGSESGTVRLYAVDGTTGQTSGAVYLADADPRPGVGGWITVSQREITLQPGEQRSIPFTLVVPAAAPPGQHLGGLVAEDMAIQQGAGGGALQINVQKRSVVAVQVDLPGPKLDRMTVLGVTPGGQQGYQRLLVGLRNDGTEMVKPTGTLVVTDASGQTLQRIALNLDTVLPRTEIQYPVPVERQALGAGTYHATVQLAYGAGASSAYTGDFTVTPEQIGQVFQGARPLAPPPTVASPAPAHGTRPFHQVWSILAGVLIALSLLVTLFSLRRNTGRRA